MRPAARSLVSRLLEEFCRENGLKLTLADEHGHAGMVELPSGDRRFFVGTRFDLNPLGASEVARDKAYSVSFLKAAGVAVPESFLVIQESSEMSAELQSGLATFVEMVGFPLFVKPNSGQEGRDVQRVDSQSALHSVLDDLTRRHTQLLVQQAISGREMRAMVLNGEVLCTFERVPAEVIGDGVLSVRQLALAAGFPAPDHPEFAAGLERQGLTQDAIPLPGRSVQLLQVANLSRGGRAHFVDCSATIRQMAVAAVNTLGLRYAGVDVMIPDEGSQVVLEVNAAPGLAHLWRQGSTEDKSNIEALYRKVFAAAFGALRSDEP